ncbi:MAG: hypothetical protein CM15mV5_3190 [uncultured marine virus]|nr:MAG: hypothetical protein CM15mV5_3190 [uncultured marine virus]
MRQRWCSLSEMAELSYQIGLRQKRILTVVMPVFVGIQESNLPPHHTQEKYLSLFSIMAVRTKMGGFGTTLVVEKNQKKTSQGTSKNTKYSATSRNKRKKRYRGQGRN